MVSKTIALPLGYTPMKKIIGVTGFEPAFSFEPGPKPGDWPASLHTVETF